MSIYLILILSLMIFITRTLPYFFAEKLRQAKMVEYIGKQLPAYIMMLLLIYEIDVTTFLKWPYGIPHLIALLIVILIHLWQRQVLLSLFLGTISYLFLTNFF